MKMRLMVVVLYVVGLYGCVFYICQWIENLREGRIPSLIKKIEMRNLKIWCVPFFLSLFLFSPSSFSSPLVLRFILKREFVFRDCRHILTFLVLFHSACLFFFFNKTLTFLKCIY